MNSKLWEGKYMEETNARVGPKRRLSNEELMLSNCGAGGDPWRFPWTARRSNQSILKEINTEYSLEGLLLTLKLQYFGHQMRRANSLKKTLNLGKIEDRRRKGWQRIRWLDDIIDPMGMSLSKLWEIVKDGEAWYAAVLEVTKNWIWPSDNNNRWRVRAFLAIFAT